MSPIIYTLCGMILVGVSPFILTVDRNWSCMGIITLLGGLVLMITATMR